MDVRPHDRFRSEALLTARSIADFACAVGDSNPLHYDADYARGTRYGGLIASGPQTSALLMAAVAAHFSRGAGMVGLEFDFRFRAPVPADERVELEWLVISVRAAERSRACVVDLRGRLKLASGATAVGAKGRVLVGEGL